MAQSKRMDISAYKSATKPEPVLKEALAQPPKAKPDRAPKPKANIGGRPPKPAKERRNQKITINMTEAEKAVVQRKAGFVPEATFLVNVLRESGVFDDTN